MNNQMNNLIQDITKGIAYWEMLVQQGLLSTNCLTLIDKLYQTLTKYQPPSKVSNLITLEYKKLIGDNQ